MNNPGTTKSVTSDRQQTASEVLPLFPTGGIRISITQIRSYTHTTYGWLGPRKNHRYSHVCNLPYRHRITIQELGKGGVGIGVKLEKEFPRAVASVEGEVIDWLMQLKGFTREMAEIAVKVAKDLQTKVFYKFDSRAEIYDDVIDEKLMLEHLKAVASERNSAIQVGGI